MNNVNKEESKMVTFDEKVKTAIRTLYDYAEKPDAMVGDMRGKDIKNMLIPAVGSGFADAVFTNLCQNRFLVRTRLGIHTGDSQYSFTEVLFRAADQVLREQPDGSDSVEISGKSGYAYFKDNLLIALARKDAQSSDIYDLKLVAEEFSLPFNSGWVRKAGVEFRDLDYIQEAFTLGGGEDGGLGAELTGAGLEQAELLAKEYGLDLISVVEEAPVPAADRFVSLAHNSEPYKQAVSSLDDVVKEFSDDKTKDNELGPEKAVLLRMLEAGREYLNDAKVRVQTVVSSVVEPLKIIVTKYDQAVVGALAGTALNLLLELLGIL